MKTQAQIESRLRKLRFRYLRKFLVESQKRVHRNCVFNSIELPANHIRKTEYTNVKISPRKQITLLVIQPDKPVSYCTFNSPNNHEWNGIICDNDSISEKCKYFKPIVSLQESRKSFDLLIENDEYVLNNFKDVASLQWILEERASSMKISRGEKFSLILTSYFILFLNFFHILRLRVSNRNENRDS